MNAATRATSPTETRFQHLSADALRLRKRTQRTARRLSLVAMRSWEKALTGVLAVPVAAALTSGAAALFAVSLLERTFEMFESTLSDVGQRVGERFDWNGEPRSDDASHSTNGVDAGGASPTESARTGATKAATHDVRERHVARARGEVSRGAVSSRVPSASDPIQESRRARAKTDDLWDVVLIDAGTNAIALIRELRELTGRDLRDLETLVGSVPEPVKRGVLRADAESLRTRIEAAGGRVEVRRGAARESDA
jgi:large subunit ribosomal protein L7/L12